MSEASPAPAPAPLARAAILAVGSELLTPSRVDTNSLFITDQLNRVGIEVVYKTVIGDDRDELAQAIGLARTRADLVVCSGGLGPTDDDVTREVVAAVLDRPLREDAAITAHLLERFAARNLPYPMPETNRRQAQVPDGAEVLANPFGSAPGLWIPDGPRVVLLLPGPPRELKPMMTALFESHLRQRSPGQAVIRRILRIVGRIESQVDEVLHPLYEAWSAATPPVAATILAALGQIELHVSTRADSIAAAERVLDQAVERAIAVLGDDVFSTDGRTLEAVVGEALAERGLRIAVAESCTGGLVTSRITDVAGSSRYLEQAIVVYANAAKTTLLGVPEELLAQHGAVSEPVARAMAKGMRERAAADVGVGVTGIAGPGGGSDEKPIGTVVVAVALRGGATRAQRYRFFGERDRVKFQASQAALDMVRRMLWEIPVQSRSA
jgi:nicotinamide-nucleotide amidase